VRAPRQATVSLRSHSGALLNISAKLVELLRCPFCSSDIRTKSVLRTGKDSTIQFGLLECRECNFEYPVIDGIPILMAPHESVDSKFETNALTLLKGPTVGSLSWVLKAGEPIRAMSLLFNPSKLGGDWLLPLDASATVANQARPATRIEGDQPSGYGGRLERAARKIRREAQKAAAPFVLPHARLRLADYLAGHGSSLSALDVMDLYYRCYSGTETFNYFAYRFGQPRHLAALSLACLLDDTTGPILDLACGVGHITHYLSVAQPRRTVVGLDRDFVRLWIANRYVAPDASYVCASADQALPFRDNDFAGVFCSDAFHYFCHRAASVREMRRLLARDGTLAIARFGNAAVEPREGYELTVGGYEKLLHGMRHVFAGEAALLDAYISRKSADLSESEPTDRLQKQKWLSVVASGRSAVFRPGEPLPRWPHAVGRLQINPIYKVERTDANGDVHLRFQFPSDWYKFENDAYLRYAPERCVLPGLVARALEKNEPGDELESYVSKFVIIGMPDRYVQRDLLS
jgi:ubiquinone/menaquinone biosynthesis C-methylase UbiE/uncharacterized protein YbaR (Trm112 family)